MTTDELRTACAWCGLPVGGTGRQMPDEPPEDEYCCFGCRFAAQVTQDRGESGQVQWTLTRLGLAIFFTMAVMVFTMALWSRDVYGTEELGAVGDTLTELFRWLCLIGALPVLFLLGVPVAASAVVDLTRGRVTSDLLVATGVTAAFAFSVVSLLRGTGAIYFEVPSMVLVLVTLGRWIEAGGRVSTGRLLDSLDRLLPETARLIHDGQETDVATGSLKTGDVIRVLCGERIPADGVLLSAESVSIDQQILTGESDAVLRRSGDDVFSGTVPLDSEIVVRVTRSAHQGTLSQILDAVQTARQQRGRYQRLADRATTWFVPLVALLAIAAFFLQGGLADVGSGLLAALAVTLIACPCALGLATSMAVWTALQRAAGRGVLIRSGEVLETLAAVRAVRFDKTGTLTTGHPTVDDLLLPDGGSPELVRDIAAALAGSSTHAFSRAIVEWAGRESLPVADGRTTSEFTPTQSAIGICSPVRTLSGLGLEADCRLPGSESPQKLKSPAHCESSAEAATRVWMGSRRLLASQNCGLDKSLDRALTDCEKRGQSVVLIGWDGEVRGAFMLRETDRPEVETAIADCQRLGLNVGILSGDRRFRVDQLGERLSIAAVGELLPADKLAALDAARRQFGPVLMVGDGINDGPALAGADVAASLAGGTDLSRDASGVCLLHDELAGVPWVIALSRQTRRIIRQNLMWAFGYNFAGMLLAVAGILNPIIAAGLMFLSSAVVLGNSRRLAAFPLGPESLPDARQSPSLLSEPKETSSAAASVESGDDSSASSIIDVGSSHADPSRQFCESESDAGALQTQEAVT
ncbi:heavy metal translocating P-type ATPase [bacterium]|nr:heavy metal translocating P-type ATPase [bacterium]